MAPFVSGKVATSVAEELRTVLKAVSKKNTLKPNAEAQKYLNQVKAATKKRTFNPVKVHNTEDALNKGYMQTEAFWNDPHNANWAKLSDHIAQDYHNLNPSFFNLFNKPCGASFSDIRDSKIATQTLREKLAMLCEKDGTTRYIECMKKLREHQGIKFNA